MLNCLLIKRNIVVVYIYPVFGGIYDHYARRFVQHYKSTMPQIEHRLFVVCNGGQPTQTMLETFGDVHVTWVHHNNSGYDIGAFQYVARTVDCEIMAFFGNSAYLPRPGWLERMVECHDAHGLALYGSMGNKGNLKLGIWPHVRTTGWWINPGLLRLYPKIVTHPGERYEFEHGRSCLSEWILKNGLNRWVATHDQIYPYELWDSIPNGMHRGDQSDLLSGDRLTEKPYYPK